MTILPLGTIFLPSFRDRLATATLNPSCSAAQTVTSNVPFYDWRFGFSRGDRAKANVASYRLA